MEEGGEILQLAYQSGPVTALKVIDDILLAGIGSRLHVYNLQTTQRIQVIQVLPHQNIHGISQAHSSSNAESSEKLLCVFGEKTFQVIQYNQQINRISREGKPLEIRDWIWDVQWLKTAQNPDVYDCLALVTGHNCIVHINWRSSQVLDNVQCEEQCILYCGHFIGSVWDHLILAAGTVFNQIILWAPTAHLMTADNLTISKPIHRLTGHQGVIFSIHYHGGLRRICSASDDRSIRVWQLRFPTEDTGNDLSILDWQGVVSECLHVLYGHQARVWRARLTSTGLTSIGEDATCCVWDQEGKIRHKFKGHRGKGIWSMAINKKEDLVATGGGDSSIRVWSVDSDLSSNSVSSEQLQINHLEPKTEIPNFPRSVAHMNFNTILVMTNSGSDWLFINRCQHLIANHYTHHLQDSPIRLSILLNPFHLDHRNAGSHLFLLLLFVCVTQNTHHRYRKFVRDNQVVPTVSTCKLHLLLSAEFYTEALRINVEVSRTTRHHESQFPKEVREETPEDACLCNCKYIECDLPQFYNGKVFNLFWIDDTYLFSTGPEGHMTLSTLKSRNTSPFGLEPLKQFILPQSKQRWATSACLLPSTKALVCGDRNGSVHLYLNQEEDSELATSHKQSFYKIHGKAGVTDVRSHNGYIFTAGRDGQYRQFNLSDDNTLQLLNSNKVFKGFEWIDQLLFDEDEELLILGFHSTNFIVWSCAKSQKLLEISCGGGHRGWSCQLREDSARFVYIKARDVVVCKAKIPSNQKVIKPSHHGRQQTNMKHLFSTTDSKGQDRHICVTCSDDTTIQVVELVNDHSKNMDLKVLSVFRGHISSIQALVCLKTLTPPRREDGQSYLILSAGGRAQFNCYRLTFFNGNNQKEKDGPDTVCVPEHLCSEFLVKRLPKHWAVKNLTVDPETRIIGLTAFYGRTVHPRIPENIVLIGMAGSDGLVRLYSFNEESRRLHPLWQSSVSDSCILQVTHFVHSPNADDISRRIFLLSAATDGYIRFWEITVLCHSLLRRNSREIPSSSENGILENFAGVQDDLSETLSEFSDEKTEESNSKNSCERMEESDFGILAHMSGINSLHIQPASNGRYILASGGDDNAFFVTSFVLCPTDSSMDDQAVTCQFSLTNPFAHAAQITGIHIINEHFIVTSSIDQRICIWHLQSDETEKKYVCVLSRYVEVSDLSTLEVWKCSNRLFIGVCGAGLCVLSISAEFFDNEGNVKDKIFSMSSLTSTHLVKCP